MKARSALAMAAVASTAVCAGLLLQFVPHPGARAEPKYRYAEPEDLHTSGPFLASRDLLADPLWDDGRAEFSMFRGTIQRLSLIHI